MPLLLLLRFAVSRVMGEEEKGICRGIAHIVHELSLIFCAPSQEHDISKFSGRRSITACTYERKVLDELGYISKIAMQWHIEYNVAPGSRLEVRVFGLSSDG